MAKSKKLPDELAAMLFYRHELDAMRKANKYRCGLYAKPAIEHLLNCVDVLVEQLQTMYSIVCWAGGSDDFAKGGKARKGWEAAQVEMETASMILNAMMRKG